MLKLKDEENFLQSTFVLIKARSQKFEENIE